MRRYYYDWHRDHGPLTTAEVDERMANGDPFTEREIMLAGELAAQAMSEWNKRFPPASPICRVCGSEFACEHR